MAWSRATVGCAELLIRSRESWAEGFQSVITDQSEAILVRAPAVSGFRVCRGTLRAAHQTMCVKHKWLTFAMLVLFSATTAAAQTAATPRTEPGNLLTTEMTVWIVDSSGHEQRERVVNVSGDTVTTSANSDSRRLLTNDIQHVEVRQSDSPVNGALIGAGTAVASGLFLCTRTEPWRNCRDDVGPMLRIGAVGAATGIGIDALIRGRRTIYRAGRGASMRVAPVVGARRAGSSTRHPLLARLTDGTYRPVSVCCAAVPLHLQRDHLAGLCQGTPIPAFGDRRQAAVDQHGRAPHRRIE